MLVGNKQDVRDDPQLQVICDKGGSRITTREEGLAIAKKINAISYLECSAKMNAGIEEVFDTAARATLKPSTKTKKGLCEIL